MDASSAPRDLVAALLTAGYRVVGPVGRGADGPAWSAVALDGAPDRVVVRTVDLAPDPRRRARLERLRGVRHDHLAHVREVVEITPDRCALLVDHLVGPTLAALRTVRGPLTCAEAVTLVVPLADALEALHAAGLVHADVSPSNVVIQLDGRPALVDLVGSVVGSAGTAGYTAPEVERGQECGPPGDVFALASVVLAHLGPPEHDPPGEPGEWTDARRIRGLLGAATDPDPDARLGARDLADACFRAHEPAAITLPDPAVLARAELLLLGGPERSSTTRERSSRHRGRRSWLAPVVRLAVAATAVGVCGLITLGLTRDGAEAGPARVAVSTDPAAVVADDPVAADPVAAATALTTRRAAAIASGSASALGEVEVDGSPAQVADAALLHDLDAQGLRVDGLRVDVADASLIAATGVEAQVSVTAAWSAYRLLRADGSVERELLAAAPRTVVLVLRRPDAADPSTPATASPDRMWRVAEVRDPGAAGSTP